MAYVDESPITGESAPVLKESGTDTFSTVTAGATIISGLATRPRDRRSG